MKQIKSTWVKFWEKSGSKVSTNEGFLDKSEEVTYIGKGKPPFRWPIYKLSE